MCQLSNTVTNNDMKQGNFGTIYNFKHSIKKKKNPNQKSHNSRALTKAEFGPQSRAAAKCTYTWDLPSRRERSREPGASWLSGVPSGLGGNGCPPEVGFGGRRRCQLAPGCQTWLGCVSTRSCGAMWKHGLQHSRLSAQPLQETFIYVPVLSQPPSQGCWCCLHPRGISSLSQEGWQGALRGQALHLWAQGYVQALCRQPGAFSLCVLLHPALMGLVVAADLCRALLNLGDDVSIPVLCFIFYQPWCHLSSSFTLVQAWCQEQSSGKHWAACRGEEWAVVWGRWAGTCQGSTAA